MHLKFYRTTEFLLQTNRGRFFLGIAITCLLGLSGCKKNQRLLQPDDTEPIIETTIPKDSVRTDTTLIQKGTVEIPLELDLLGDTTSEAFEGEVLVNQSKNLKFTAREWQGIPSVEVSKDGKIFVAWYTGGKTEGPGNYITVSVSEDNGQTWKSNALIVNPTVNPVRFFDPCIWKDKYGEICLSWAKSKNQWDGKGGVWFSRLKYKDSVQFSRPRRLSDGIMMNRPTYTFDKTAALYSISVWQKLGGTYVYKSQLSKTENTGLSSVSSITIPSNIRSFDEHQILQLADLSYLMLIRCSDGIRYSKTSDLTLWPSPQPFNSVGLTTSSRFSLTRLSSGKIALVLNNNSYRATLKIFLSDDEGLTWKYSMLIDNRSGVSYPDLTEDSLGNILVSYDFDRFKSLEINVVKFKEADVINNRTSSIIRYSVSKK